ncbi:MAG: hypothetical protein JOY80_01815 [Candidatus Dormibacteraeota bacterium]|nr:hypothetical protein [Candidatus Dormibacteraeota bacterium]
MTPVAPASSRWKLRLEATTSPSGLFVSAILVLSLLPVTSIIHDPDFWWHLRAGQLILAHGGLLGTDPFTFTVASHQWTMHEWLTEVMYALMNNAGGFGLILLVLSVVTWLGLLCVALRAQLRNANRLALGLGILLAAVAGYPIWGPRVQMVTFCLTTLTLLMVERHLVRGGRAIWLLVPLFLLWSNLHSGFIIGLAFIALVIVAELAGRWLRFIDNAPPSRLKPLALVLLACTAVSMVNPNGPAILFYAFATQGSGAQQALILEWHSPSFQDWVVIPFGVMLVSLIALVTVNRKLRARDAALMLAATALSLQSVRHIAIFIAAVTPVWIDQLAILVRSGRLRRGGRAAPRVARAAGPSFTFKVAVFGALMSVLMVVYASLRLIPAMRVQPTNLVYAQEYPVCAARWLAQAPQPLKIFNQYGEGGYLTYALSGTGDKLYIFGDAALMGDQMLYTYAAITSLQPSWDATIRGSGADIVLFDTGTPLANAMSASTRWVKVYEDPLSIAFVPSDRLSQVKLAPVPTSYPAGDACGEVRSSSLDTGAQNQ